MRLYLHTSILLAIVIAAAALTGVYTYKHYCRNNVPARSEFGKSPVLVRGQVSPGFMLFTPLNLSSAPFKGGTVYLTNLYGQVVHTWKTKAKTQYAILKSDSHLVVSQANIDNKKYPQAARITSIQELDAESNLIWEYKNDALHHDFDVLPNDNIAVLEWVKIPTEKITSVVGGRSGTEFNKEEIFTDRILEVDRDKNVVWSWNALDHIGPEEFKIPEMFPRDQWSHANSIKYIKSDPFFSEEAYLVSMRYFNTVFLISRKTGEIIWRSPQGLLGHQHDATFLESGNILIFNNAFHTSVSLNYFNYGSSVIEINPVTNKVEWEFSGGSNPLDKARLTEVILSGAQRLSNGNTLITLGTTGHLLEVTKEGKVVWDMVNPYSDSTTEAFPSNYLFKSRRYSSRDVPWLEKFGDSLPTFAEYCD